jgi:hypothetical protein
LKISFDFNYCFLLLLLFSCIDDTEKKKQTDERLIEFSEVLNEEDTIAVPLDTIPNDTIVEIKAEKKEFSINKNSKALNKLLHSPFDLVAFKKKMRISNSGMPDVLSCFFRPKKKGFYYRYFVFQGCSSYGLIINVYKFGKDPGRFSDTNETLISMDSECELKQLGNFNLAGSRFSDFKNKYGENYLTIKNAFVYTDGNNLLILKCNGDNIRKFRYIRTNIKIRSTDDLPADLFLF